jgi:hypothetical protein
MDFLSLNLSAFRNQDVDETHQGAIVPNSIAANSEALEREAAKALPYYYALNDISANDCDLTQASKDLDKALAALQKAARNILIIIAPTTPLQTGYAPKCFLPAVQAMLMSKAGPHIKVHAGDWKTFGLNYTHYVHSLPGKRKNAYINVNHTNYVGARVVTKRVAEMMGGRLKVGD